MLFISNFCFRAYPSPHFYPRNHYQFSVTTAAFMETFTQSKQTLVIFLLWCLSVLMLHLCVNVASFFILFWLFFFFYYMDWGWRLRFWNWLNASPMLLTASTDWSAFNQRKPRSSERLIAQTSFLIDSQCMKVLLWVSWSPPRGWGWGGVWGAKKKAQSKKIKSWWGVCEWWKQ